MIGWTSAHFFLICCQFCSITITMASFPRCDRTHSLHVNPPRIWNNLASFRATIKLSDECNIPFQLLHYNALARGGVKIKIQWSEAHIPFHSLQSYIMINIDIEHHIMINMSQIGWEIKNNCQSRLPDFAQLIHWRSFSLERLRGDSSISAPPDSRQCQELPFLCFSLSCPELEKTPHGNDMQCQFWSKNAFREEYEINFLRLLVLFSPKKYFPRKMPCFLVEVWPNGSTGLLNLAGKPFEISIMSNDQSNGLVHHACVP